MSRRLAIVALAITVAALIFLLTEDGAIRCASVIAVALSIFLPLDPIAKEDWR